MTAAEISRLDVKVFPSTGIFERSLLRYLERIEQRHRLEIPVVIDTDALDVLERDLAREIAQMDRRADVAVDVDVHANTSGLTDELTVALDDITRQVRVDVPADVDDARLRESLAETVDQVERTTRLDVPAEADGGRLRESLSEAVDEAERNTRIRVPVHTDPGEVDRAGRDAGTQLATSAGEGMASGFGGTSPYMFAGVIAAATLAGPLVSAGILAGFAGGIIGLGAFALRDNEKLQEAGSGFLERVNGKLTEAAAPLEGPFIRALDIIADAIDELDLKAIFEAVAPYIEPLAAGIGEFLEKLSPGLLDAVKAGGPLLETIANNLGPLAEDLSTFLSAIADDAPVANKALNALFEIIGFGLNVLYGLIFVLGSVFLVAYDAFTGARDIASDVWDFLTGLFDGGDLGRAAERALAWVLRVFHDVWDDAEKAAEDAIAWVLRQINDLPGKARRGLGDLGGVLWDAGRNLVQGLIDGIEAMFPSLNFSAAGMAQIVRDYWPFSPAKRGPLSGSGSPEIAGRNIARMVADGMRWGEQLVASASGQLAGAATIGGTGMLVPAGAAGAGTDLRVVVEGTGLLDNLRYEVHKRGGNVQRAFGGED